MIQKLQRFRTLHSHWSEEPRNMSIVFHSCCVMICTGWLLHSGCSIQACRDCSAVTLVLSSKVPCRQLRAIPKFPVTTYLFGQNTEYSTVSSQHIWHPGFLSHQPDGLIYCTIWPSSPNTFSRTWKCISVLDIRNMSASEVSVSRNRAIQIDIYLL